MPQWSLTPGGRAAQDLFGKRNSHVCKDARAATVNWHSPILLNMRLAGRACTGTPWACPKEHSMGHVIAAASSVFPHPFQWKNFKKLRMSHTKITDRVWYATPFLWIWETPRDGKKQVQEPELIVFAFEWFSLPMNQLTKQVTRVFSWEKCLAARNLFQIKCDTAQDFIALVAILILGPNLEAFSTNEFVEWA